MNVQGHVMVADNIGPEHVTKDQVVRGMTSISGIVITSAVWVSEEQ